MKKIFYVIFLVLLTVSCNKPKEVALEFEKDPDSRIADTLSYVRKMLVESPYGWKGSLVTEYAGAYGFYMQFGKNDRVKMVADLDEETASKEKESTYRIRQIMTSTLSFDTYTYLTMLEDPNPATYNGQPGKGMGSDIEFNYIKTHGDTLFFEGRKFQKSMILVKATASESQQYLSNGFGKSRSQLLNYTDANPNLYLQIPSLESKISVSFSDESRTASLTYISGKEIVSKIGKYNFDLGGLNFAEPVVLGDLTIVKAKMQDGKFMLLDSSNKPYEIKSNAVPVLPITAFFGYRDTYNSIQIDGATLPGGINSAFNDIWAKQINTYNGWGVKMVSMTFRLVSSQKAKLEVWFFFNGYNYRVDVGYDYVMTDNIIKLSNEVQNDLGWIHSDIKSYFKNAEFKLDYVASSDPKVRGVGGLIKTNNPNSFFYGKLVKLSN